MHQGLKLVTAPAVDPVSVADVKNYLRINGTTDDAMLGAFITAAVNVVESYLGRRLITQTWALFMDRFPGNYDFSQLRDGVQEGKLSEYFATEKHIDLPLMPLRAIDHLKTYDNLDASYTMSASEYFVDTVSEPGRISLRTDSTWPTTDLRQANGIEVQFQVGYGAAGSSVPAGIIQAIKEIVAKFYESRGCSDTSIPAVAVALLTPYKIMRLC